MSERLSGFQQMAENADAHIAATQSAATAAENALHSEALAMDKQINAGNVWANRLDVIEDSNNTPEARDKNNAAEIAIFGSKGRTEGYVDVNDNPITQPILGKIDQLRDKAGVQDIRDNRRYGTRADERNAKADAYEVQASARADQYLKNVEELLGEGFELSQAKLIMDMREERQARESRVFQKLRNRYTTMEKPDGTPAMDPETAFNRASRETYFDTLRKGDDERLTKTIIRDRIILDANDYTRFRYKHGRPASGERKEFTNYKDNQINAVKDQIDTAERQGIEQTRDNKELAREQVREAEREGRGDDPTLRMPIVNASPVGLRNRLKAMMGRGSEAVINAARLAHYKANQFYGDKEKGKRRKISTAIIGGLALTGAAILLADGSSSTHHSHMATEHMNHRGGKPHEHLPKHLSKKSHQTTPRTHMAQPSMTTIQKGQDPWSISAHQLGVQDNPHLMAAHAAQIEAYDKEMAKLNPHVYTYGGTSSEHIAAGTKLVLPRR